jgi:gas vesicle structural protein
MSIVPSTGSVVDRPSGGSLADVVGLILDKGLVIDVYVRVSLIGIEILTVDARVVVASVDTYLRFAEAAGRLNLEATRKPGLPELIYGAAGAVKAATSRKPASIDAAPDAAALSAGGVGFSEQDGHDEHEPVGASAGRKKSKKEGKR